MMSGGEKQLLAIASIYATNPDVYVFDEPSANIDEYGIER
ncbi:ATP-binding cassette domain-containing protein, partial [Peptoniphilus harei]